jgi:CheY-like chemotaxis protein
MDKDLTLKELADELKKLEKDEAGIKQAEKTPQEIKETPAKMTESTERRIEIHRKGVKGDTKERILVIDDAEIDRMILKEILTQAGYEVFMAADGKEGLEVFYHQPVDLIITDMIMPEKLGIEVIMEIYEDYPETKIIAISAGDEYGAGLDLDMAKKFNVPTISKPFKAEEIVDAVKKLLT